MESNIYSGWGNEQVNMSQVSLIFIVGGGMNKLICHTSNMSQVSLIFIVSGGMNKLICHK